MLGFKFLSPPPLPSIASLPTPNLAFISFLPRTHFKIPKTQSRFLFFAQTNNNSPEPKLQEKEKLNGFTDNGGGGSNGGGDDPKKDRSPLLNIKWVELLLDPDPDNIIAVGLTGLLTWASVQVLWQLFIVSVSILVAALKYSFIAALLLFILITLL
ncbi:hypothetical protein JCGZ_01521 [Jatropha curcas]|uniref:Transmembrane protein n=1 Tax=Jatropha curcas TaxID=180498 RepID=A0A067L981_JATCU|nr:uncharacterized protein LOC105648190 [Jatropha curcas]KDP45021.1 hypothetical protein JCGZ_01521 [Jatropha curcas]